MKVDGEALTLGFVIMGVSVALLVYVPGVVRKWQASISGQYAASNVPPGTLQAFALIWWLQRLAIRALGVFVIAVGTLLLLTGVGLVDGFAVLDRVEGWLRQ